MRSFSFSVVLMAATTLAVAGDFEANRRAWLEGPTSFLLGEADRSELALLSSPDQLAAFERLFWARRDPDLATPGSEAKVDFEARVTAADDKLGTAVTRRLKPAPTNHNGVAARQ